MENCAAKTAVKKTKPGKVKLSMGALQLLNFLPYNTKKASIGCLGPKRQRMFTVEEL